MDYLEKVFKCGRTELSRADLESCPCPFCTFRVSDDEMQSIVDDIELEMQDWNEWLQCGDISQDKFDAHWRATMEEVVTKHGVPYYEDLHGYLK